MATLAAAPPLSTRATARPRAVALWLAAVAALVFAMVVVGGVTRLTESGLSIVKWDVVSGTLPPLSDDAWQAEFRDYQASPQYQKINRGMTLGEFKGIFFWEYVHRLLGRVIGAAFALPLLWFWVRGAIPRGYKPRLLALLALGGLQGTVGWWMVASGLVDRPAVAHERLATHLVVALTIMAGCIWTALDLVAHDRPSVARPRRWLWALGPLLAVQIVYGAFTAGLRAGHLSDTWPRMYGAMIPPDIFAGAAALIDDPSTIYFTHRTLAWGVAAAALAAAWICARGGAGRRAYLLGILVLFQFALGVATVVSGISIPIAAAHQAGAALLLAATVWLAHWAYRPPVGLRVL